MRTRSVRRSSWSLTGRRMRPLVRLVTVLLVAALAVGSGVSTAGAATRGFPALSLPSLTEIAGWFSSPHWGRLPQQAGGTAAGRSHVASAASTRSGRGTGGAPGTGRGQLASYTVRARKVSSGLSAAAPVGFNARTSKRVASKSSATVDYFQNADGSVTRRVRQTPVNYRDAKGDWQPVNTTVSVGTDQRWHEAANSLAVDFAPKASTTSLAAFAVDGSHKLTYGLQGAAAVTGTARGSTVTYPGVLPLTDLLVAPTTTGLKESVVLHSAAAGNQWVFPLQLQGLTAVQGTAGAIDLRNAAGRTVEEIPPAYAFDSKVDPHSGDPATTHAVSYTLQQSAGHTALVVTLDRAWLDNPARRFPVTVDPSINDAWTTTYAESANLGDHSTELSIKAGSYDSGTHSAVGYIAPQLGTFDGSKVTVTAASLQLFDTWASTCAYAEEFDVAAVSAAWTPSGVTGWPGPAYGASIGSLTPATSTLTAACGNTAADRTVGDWLTVPLSTTTFQGWANGTTADHGLAVYAATTNDLTWKQFGSFYDPGYAPILTLTYTGNVAPQLTQTYPANDTTVSTLTPELAAAAIDDGSPNTTLEYDFQIYDSTDTKVVDSGLVTGGDWSVTAGKLKWGQTYEWTVQAYDGSAYSTAAAWASLTPQVPQPVTTSSLSQNSSDHGYDASIGNYTTEDTDASVSVTGPSLDVVRDYNSRDPRTTGGFGAGWSSIFDARAAEQYDTGGAVASVQVTYPDGSVVGFGKNSDGSYSPPSGRFATFKPVTGGYTLTDKNDTVYTFTQALGSGVYGITSVTDADARAVTFTWSSGQITTMTSVTSGRSLHLVWSTPSGATSAHIATVSTDPVTGTDQSTDLVWTYSYTGDALSSLCAPADGTHCTSYGYTTGSQYQAAGLDLDPHSLWTLSDASGTTATSAVIANEGSDNATYSNVTLGQSGPLSGSTATAAGFNGTSSTVTLPNSLAVAANAQTVSLWFKTSSSTASVLYGASSVPVSNGSTPGYYQPMLYIGSSGYLNAEFWYSAGVSPISETLKKVNDGQWHHAVLAAAGASQTLYLDGVNAGTASGTVSVGGGVPVQTLSYPTVGAGFLGGAWPDEPNEGKSGNTGYASYFNGSIADVGLYSYPLSQAQVTALHAAGTSSASLLSSITRPSGKAYAAIAYNASTATVTQVTDENGGTWKLGTPTVTGSSQVYRSAVLGAAPTEYFRLGEGAGAASALDETRGGLGTYSNVTLGAAGPFSDSTAASFNGTSSLVSLPTNNQVTAGSNSVELWFKMPSGSTAGGVLFDYAGASLTGGSPASNNYVPALYVGVDGLLHGRFYGYGYVTSTGKVNDGQWHHALLASGGTTEALYLDGTQQSSSTGAFATAVSTYLYVGAGESSGWTSAPTNTLGYFPGSIADFALYHSQLTAADASAHFQAAHNSAGLLPLETVTVTDPGGKTLSSQYDVTNGNRTISETDALGNRTSYGYDTGGFEHTVIDPDGAMTITGHDVRGNTVSSTTCQNQAANQCSTQYFSYYPDDTTAELTTADPRNDLPLTARSGRSTSATDNTFLTSYGYNTAGDETSVTTPAVPGSPSGRTTSTVYSDGTATYPAADTGNVPKGLPVSTTSPGGAVNTVAYLHNGDVASTTDADGQVTKYSYDGLGRVLTETVVSDTYPNGLTRTLTYDANGQVTKESDPPLTDRVTGAVHTAVSTTVYDADGDVTSQTVADATGGDAPRTDTTTYNAYDQVASHTDANGNAGAADGNTTTSSYDAYGNRISDVDQNGTTTRYAYDADGNLLTQSLASYTGDPVNPSTATTLIESSRAYDPAGRLASITDSMGNTTSYTYTDNGLTSTVTRTDATGKNSFVLQSNSYDAAGDLVQQVTNNGATVTNYTVDAASRTTSTVTDPTSTDRTTQVSYTPDDLVATSTQHDSSGYDRTTSKTYDPMGNTLTETLSGDASGHPSAWYPLNQTAGTAVTDASGNGYTATADSGVTWSGSGATFAGSTTGTGGLISANAPVLTTNSSYTVSAWVDPADVSTYRTFVGQAGATASAFYLQYSKSYGGWAFITTSADATTATQTIAHTSSATSNTWTHLVGVYNSSTGAMSLYVNGALAASATAATTWNASGPLTVGGVKTTGGTISNVVNGQVSDVQAYQRALSAAEVATLYGNGRSGGTVGSSNAQTTTYTYDKRGLPTSMTDADGNTTNYSYDEAGNLAVTTAPAVSVETNGGTAVSARPVTTSGFNTFGEATEEVDPDGNQTDTAYDANGQKVSETLPSYTPPGSSTPITATSTWTYDADGNVVGTAQPDGETTSTSYDQIGDAAQVTAADGSKTHAVYDTNGELVSQTDGTGATTQATYDWMGRQLTSTTLERYPTAQALTSTNSYAVSAGNAYGAFLTSTTTPGGVTTGYKYNSLGETTAVTDGAGNTTTYSYDFMGNQQKTTLPDGTWSDTDYNVSDQPFKTTQYDAASTVLSQTGETYDGVGNLISSTDANGHTSHFTYDAAGTVTQETQPVSATSSITTSFGYDAAGQRTRYTDGRGNSWIYTYTPWGQSQSVVAPATSSYTSAADSTTTDTYNGDGQLVSAVQPGGITTTLGYDKVGNLTSESGTGADAATASRSFTYDSAGQVLTAGTSTAGTSGTTGYQSATSESFTYNDRGSLLTASGSAGSSSFGYNSDGSLTSRTDAAGTTSYGYDTAGRLSTLNDAATGTQLGYNYNTLNQVASIKYGSTGQTRTYSYNTAHELTGDTLTQGSTTLASMSYGYDADGNLTTKTTTGVTGASSNTYTYDWANRLTSWNNGSTTTAYAYDASSNRVQVGSNVYTYDARDELTSDGVNSYRYSAAGTLQMETTPSGSTTYTTDAYGQQITDGTQGYTLDASGRNITDTDSTLGTSRTFQYSGGGDTIAGDGDYTYTYDPSGGLIGLNTAGAGSTSTGTLALTDQHSDVVAGFTSGATTLTGSATYDPLGNVTASSGTAGGHLGFQSGWTENSTAQVGTASRWYNPATGTFLNKDSVSPNPVPNSASANPFAYIGGNPLSATDPSGHCWFGCSIFNAVSNAVSSAVDDVSSGWDDFSSTFSSGWDDFAHYTYHAVAAVVHTVKHAVSKAVHRIADVYRSTVRRVRRYYHYAARRIRRAYHAAVHAVSSAYHAVRRAAKRVVHAIKKAAHAVAHAARSAYHATVKAVKTAAIYAKHHAAAITSFVVSAAVGMGCEAVTAGIGTIGCAAIAGAVGSLVTQGFACADKGGSSCSAGAFASSAVDGAVAGAVGGALGALGGKLLSKVAPKALDAVGGLFGKGATEAGDSAAADATDQVANDSVADEAGSAEQSSCPTGPSSIPHSFTAGTRVLMANGSTRAISTIKVGDTIANAVPGLSGTQSHQVTAVIVTHTDHDFADVTIAPTKAATATLRSRVLRKAALGLAASAAGIAALLATHHQSATPAQPVAYTAPAATSTATPATTADQGGVLHTTFHHPFYDETQTAFVEAEDLHIGDRLQTPTGTAEVTNLHLFHANTTTYDLTIGTLHTYYVEAGNTPVLVHNCGVDEKADLFDSFGVKPGENLNLAEPSAANGRSYITYVAKDADGNVRYVGRAQGKGNPLQVMKGRIARGHDIFKQNPDLTPQVVDVQQSMDASKGAEEFFTQGFAQRGASLLNSPDSPALGFSKAARGQKSVQMMDAFFDELLSR
ncbi:LamG-like jellyroll fold domain-containing protein [Streptacidiphilus sp. N1-10]|uniref:LamG-like jellyroll fold domain-containing protein n=1 Tax=Streptacidiphilus jeojiensis TaxID=3229225 RepID=A0ABV6XIX8_9ACTN